MITSRNVLRRPLVLLAVLSLASAALFVPTLPDVWDNISLRSIYFISMLSFFCVGAFAMFGEIYLRMGERGLKDAAQENALPLDAKRLKKLRKREMAVALFVAFAYIMAPIGLSAFVLSNGGLRDTPQTPIDDPVKPKAAGPDGGAAPEPPGRQGFREGK